MIQEMFRMTAGAACLALVLGGCATSSSPPSTELRLLEAYSQVAQARSQANKDLADGKLTQESWRLAMNQIDEAGAELNRATELLNKKATSEANAEITTSHKLLENAVAAR